MAERDLIPGASSIAHTYWLNRGLCPNTEEPCTYVGSLNEVRSNALKAGYPNISEEDREEFLELSQEIRDIFDGALKATHRCLGGCALQTNKFFAQSCENTSV